MLKNRVRKGSNSDVAFAQMCLETGFLRFGGLVTMDMNNFCGLGFHRARTARRALPRRANRRARARPAFEGLRHGPAARATRGRSSLPVHQPEGKGPRPSRISRVPGPPMASMARSFARSSRKSGAEAFNLMGPSGEKKTRGKLNSPAFTRLRGMPVEAGTYQSVNNRSDELFPVKDIAQVIDVAARGADDAEAGLLGV